MPENVMLLLNILWPVAAHVWANMLRMPESASGPQISNQLKHC